MLTLSLLPCPAEVSLLEFKVEFDAIYNAEFPLAFKLVFSVA